MKTTPTTLKSTGFNPEKGKKKKIRTARPEYLERRDPPASQVKGRVAPPSIELYQAEEHPFSHAVRMRLSRLGLDYVAHSVSEHDDLKHRQLVRAGGRDRIPFLIDHRTGIKLYEADAIIAYLEKEYGMPAQNSVVRFARSLESEMRSRADAIAWTVAQPWGRAVEFRDSLFEAGRSLRSIWGELRGAFSKATA
jgi:glutathione S-transferase